MIPTHNLQRQHRKLEKMAGALLAAAYRPFGSANETQRALARFSGTLRMHASMESEGLYPMLLEHRDPIVRLRAEALYGELGPLYARWDDFMKRWDDAGRIDERRTAFRVDLAKTLRVLGRRMKREDAELYPMVAELAAAEESGPG